MVWDACDPSVSACFVDAGARFLALPARGPVVKEAHLVTVDDGFGASWPATARDRIDAHHARSAQPLTEPWAPAGEGGSLFGQGSTGAKLPVVDEQFYVTMYWRDRPVRGTRMIVKHPTSGRAVVASAGWETGPGSNRAIAGVSEEIHTLLGTTHLDHLEIAFALDQELALGPITCDD